MFEIGYQLFVLKDFFSSCVFQDQVLLSMQEKLDNLCEQVSFFKDQPETMAAISVKKTDEQLPFDESSSHKIKSSCGCQLCDQHGPPANELGVREI